MQRAYIIILFDLQFRYTLTGPFQCALRLHRICHGHITDAIALRIQSSESCHYLAMSFIFGFALQFIVILALDLTVMNQIDNYAHDVYLPICRYHHVQCYTPYYQYTSRSDCTYSESQEPCYHGIFACSKLSHV